MKLLFTILFSIFFFSIAAQNSLNDTLKQQMLSEWVRAKAYTQEYLDAMPADKYSFRAVDSVRSFAEQMLHLAQANALLISRGTGFQDANIQKVFFKMGFEKSTTAQSKDSVKYFVNTSYDYIIEAIKNLDFGKLTEVISRDMPGGERTSTRLGWLLKAFEHQTHHRGQCTVYLRLVGIHPPGEKLW